MIKKVYKNRGLNDYGQTVIPKTDNKFIAISAGTIP